MSQPLSLTGSCLCKSCSYTIFVADEKELRLSHPHGRDTKIICHCAPCRILSGSAFGADLLVPSNAFAHGPASDPSSSSGTLKSFSRKGDSGRDLTNYFCGTCGVTMWVVAESVVGRVIVKAGTFGEEGMEWLGRARVEKEIYEEGRVGWVPRIVGD